MSELKPKPEIVLLFGKYDPPHQGYAWAVEALLQRPNVEAVWLCPQYSLDEAVRDMLGIFASNLGPKVASCTAAIDRRFDPVQAAEFVSKIRPQNKVVLARLASDGLSDEAPWDCSVKFGHGGMKTAGIVLERFPRIPDDLKERMCSGQDMGEWLPDAVAGYIARKGLYGRSRLG